MRVLRSFLLIAAAALAAAAPASAGVKQADVTIPASDGVNLVGDVYLPAAKGKFPAVVDMEPYGRSSATPFLDAGYAHVNASRAAT
jgi:predicted acyl esterase